MEDGRLNILVRGTRPFRLLERQDDLPYPAGVIEFLDDEGEEPDDELARSARELYRELVRQATDRELEHEELEELDAYGWRRTVEFAVDAKQELLELRSENARLRLLAALLQEAIERLGARRARAGARALERQGPLRLARRTAPPAWPAALLRQVADLLGDLQHEQRELVQDRGLRRSSCR